MMDRLPLIGGSYVARSVIANAQQCVNLYPELNTQDSAVPVTFYQRPGLAALAQGDIAPVRGIYRSSDGQGFCVVGKSVYYINPDFSLTQLGSLLTDAINPVSFIDNGATILLVDGSTSGFEIDLTSHTFSLVVDPTGAFTGADKVDYLDTFTLWNYPGTKNFGSTLSNSLTFDALYFAAKTSYPDPLVTLFVNRRELILFGQLKSELWYNAGNPLFPFASLPGAYIEHGCAAKYSPASSDLSVFWLSQDLQGYGIVMRQRGYETKRISNHALEYAIRKMGNAGGISDAIGYTYQQDGHSFYVLSFPSGNQTWVFDDSIPDTNLAWHRRVWTDNNGNLNRDRTNCHAFVYGKHLVGDWENGTIYALDQDLYHDEVGGVNSPMTCIRSFPHILIGTAFDGKPKLAAGARMRFTAFLADLECGAVPLQADGNPAIVSLRWSDDRGKTWGNAVLQSTGEPGAYLTQPQWQGLGIARDRVFELSYSVDGPAALNSAWVEAMVLDQ
jgi:hypothetical protein